MGASNLGRKFFSKLVVKFEKLVEALQAHAGVDAPVIGVDVRLIMHQVYDGSKDNRVCTPDWTALAKKVIERVRPWLVHGCRVVLVDDGQASNSKVAHFVRRAQRARERNTAMQHLCEANQLLARLRDPTVSSRPNDSRRDGSRSDDSRSDDSGPGDSGPDADADVLRALIDDNLTKANKKWKAEMSSAFSDAVEQYVRDKFGEREALAYVRAPFQADPQLVHMFREGKCHAIVSKDGDFLVYGCGFIVYPFQQKEVQKNKDGVSKATLTYVGMLPSGILEPLGISPPQVNENGMRFAALSLPARLVCATLVGNDVLPYSFHRFGPVKCVKLVRDHPFVESEEHVSVEDIVKHALSYSWFQIQADASGAQTSIRTPSAHVVHHAVLSLMFEPIRACTDYWPFVGDAHGHMSGSYAWV